MESIASAFTVVFVSHVVTVEMPIAAALFRNAKTVGAAPLVVQALGVVNAVDGDIVEPSAELIGPRAPPTAAAGVPGVLGRHTMWLGLLAAHEADLAWLALVARPPVIRPR